ncbi:MAG: homoserine dehydrogenase, partial [Lentisphaerae bacterium]|nr:homoserine dehydrogenase [Lentisphaerota bacterium]
FDLALEKGVDVFFGASVGGGIPIIRSLRDGLSGNRIETIHGILNGTCNYILSGMEKDGLTFDEALAKAQKLGFAETDPTLDVDGFDTLHKAAILSSIAFGISPDIDSLPVQGIRDELDAGDIRYAAELGYRIKLLAIIKGSGDEVEIRVAPTLIPESSMLASVNGVFNGVLVKGDLSDETMYYGQGAGRLPTASTVIGDIAEAARAIVSGSAGRISVPRAEKKLRIKEVGEVISRHYVRLSLYDAAGSLAAAAGVFGKHGVSISAAMQQGDSCEDGYASVIVLTHMTERAKMDAALSEISALECCGARPRLLGIED